MLRPQRRQAAEQRELIELLEPGDEIVSAGGLYGVIKAIDGDELQVEIADGLVVRMARGAVAGLVEQKRRPPKRPQTPTSPQTPANLHAQPCQIPGNT